MARDKFIGFTTISKKRPPFKLVDIELIKQDLMNAFMTKRGERVMRPNQNSSIFDYLYEPFDEATKQAIIDNARDIIATEPRVTNPEINVKEFEHGFTISIELTFLPDYKVDQLFVTYNRQNEGIE